MKLAIISLKSKSSEMIAEESKKYFKQVDMLDLRQIEVNADSKDVEVLYCGKKIDDYDCIYCKGSHKYAILLRAITSAMNDDVYMPLSAESFTLGHNKYLTLLELQKKKISIPKTYLAANTKSAKEIVKQIHYPAIIKVPDGTHGKGVLFADSVESANSILDALEIFKRSYIIQEYVETGATDLRTIVVGDKVVASMVRKAGKGDLRANLHAGGVATKFVPDMAVKEISVKCAKAIGANICAIDILNGVRPCVIEINVSPGLQGITEVTGKNIAGEIAKFLYEESVNLKKKKKTDGYTGVLNEFHINSGDDKNQEIVTNLDVKLGRIKLAPVISKLSGFKDEDEVIIKVKKGRVIIKK